MIKYKIIKFNKINNIVVIIIFINIIKIIKLNYFILKLLYKNKIIFDTYHTFKYSSIINKKKYEFKYNKN